MSLSAVPLWLWGALIVAVLLVALLVVMALRSLGRSRQRKATATIDNSDVIFIADKTREPFRPRTAPPTPQAENEPGDSDAGSR